MDMDFQMNMVTNDKNLKQFVTIRTLKGSNKSTILLMKNEKKGFSLKNIRTRR